MSIEISSYERQAQEFLHKYNLTFSAKRRSNACPLSCDDKKHIHGAEYEITIERGDCSRKLVFPFWNSYHDEYGPEPYPNARTIWQEEQNASARRKHKPQAPTAYDVLACISGDAHCPPCFEEFCAEFGYNTDSRKALDLFLRCSKFASELRAFFSAEEIESLQEIQ